MNTGLVNTIFISNYINMICITNLFKLTQVQSYMFTFILQYATI